MDIVLFIAFFIGSIFFAMVGLGGGVIYTPLQLLFGIPIHQAIPLSLILIIVSSISASLVYRRAKKTDWKLALFFSSQMMITAFFGGMLAQIFDQETLTIIFSAALGFAAIMLLIKIDRKQSNINLKSTKFIWVRTYAGETYSVPIIRTIALSSAAGFISGIAGTGGGAITVPIMVLMLGIPIDIAIGTSALMVGLAALAGLLGHLVHTNITLLDCLVPAIVVFIGASLGARISLRVNKVALRNLLALALFCLSIYFIF